MMAWDWHDERKRKALSDSQPVAWANPRAVGWWIAAAVVSAAVWGLVALGVRMWAWGLMPWQ